MKRNVRALCKFGRSLFYFCSWLPLRGERGLASGSLHVHSDLSVLCLALGSQQNNLLFFFAGLASGRLGSVFGCGLLRETTRLVCFPYWEGFASGRLCFCACLASGGQKVVWLASGSLVRECRCATAMLPSRGGMVEDLPRSSRFPDRVNTAKESRYNSSNRSSLSPFSSAR